MFLTTLQMTARISEVQSLKREKVKVYLIINLYESSSGPTDVLCTAVILLLHVQKWSLNIFLTAPTHVYTDTIRRKSCKEKSSFSTYLPACALVKHTLQAAGMATGQPTAQHSTQHEAHITWARGKPCLQLQAQQDAEPKGAACSSSPAKHNPGILVKASSGSEEQSWRREALGHLSMHKALLPFQRTWWWSDLVCSSRK